MACNIYQMVADRIAACMVYHGRDYRNDDALKYFLKAGERPLMHPDTARKLRYLLQLLADEGEETAFAFVRDTVLTGKSFAEEDNPCNPGAGMV